MKRFLVILIGLLLALLLGLLIGAFSPTVQAQPPSSFVVGDAAFQARVNAALGVIAQYRWSNYVNGGLTVIRQANAAKEFPGQWGWIDASRRANLDFTVPGGCYEPGCLSAVLVHEAAHGWQIRWGFKSCGKWGESTADQVSYAYSINSGTYFPWRDPYTIPEQPGSQCWPPVWTRGPMEY